MVANPKLDLGLARIAHLNWEFEMESATKGSAISPEAQSHEDCELGRWLHSSGIKQYGTLEAFQSLMVTHRNFHQAARDLDKACKGDGYIAQELEIVRRLSRDVIFHLTEIELEALEVRHQKPVAVPQPRSLFTRLFTGPFHALPEDHSTLKVSQARLIHLRWERSLMDAFRHRGRDTILESAEVCALGVWIHATGLQKHRKLPEMAQLDIIHKEFHSQANTVLRALRQKQNKRAESSYQKSRDLSRRVVYLLSAIEFKLLDSDNVQSTDSFLLD